MPGYIDIFIPLPGAFYLWFWSRRRQQFDEPDGEFRASRQKLRRLAAGLFICTGLYVPARLLQT